MRRRSVGASEGAAVSTPYQTHIRLTRHFREMADQAWGRIWQATEMIDEAIFHRFEKGEVKQSMKSADYLLYEGSRQDWVG